MGTDTRTRFTRQKCGTSTVSVWAEFKQSIIYKAIDQWQTRLRVCICAKVQHFEHLLNWLARCFWTKLWAYEIHWNVYCTVPTFHCFHETLTWLKHINT